MKFTFEYDDYQVTAEADLDGVSISLVEDENGIIDFNNIESNEQAILNDYAFEQAIDRGHRFDDIYTSYGLNKGDF